jgi:hypothetical protein
MILVTIFPYLVVVIGLLLWVLNENAIVNEAGRGSFFIALFCIVGMLSKTTVNVGGSLVAIVPILVLVTGLLIWALTRKAAVLREIGKGSFFIGVFYVVYALSRFTVHLG